MSNLQKYHVSKNLFDKDNTTIYKAYINVGGSWILADDSRSIKIQCMPNTQYTLSVPNTLTVFRLYESPNANVTPPTSGEYLSTITRNENISQYTFTTKSDTACLVFQGSATVVNEWFNSLMLNTGSSALPYEPFSVDVWHNLAPQQYINGEFVDNTNIPEKYSGGSWD